MLTSLHFNIFRRYDPKITKVSSLIIIVFSFFALLASFQLSVDKFHVLENPETKLACSINVVLNCSSVMSSSQAEILGFPNSFIGMMGYAVLLFFGISALMGVRYNKAVLRLVFAGALAAFVFAYWLFFESVFVIQILCPWCLLTTLSTTLIFAALLHISIRENIFNFSKKVHKKITRLLDENYDALFFATLLVIMTIIIVNTFGASLFT